MSQSEDWREQYGTINQLRILNKYHFECFEAKIDSFCDFVKSQVESLRSNLIKNALILVREVFSKKRDREMASFAKSILPSVLVKAIYEKNFIAQEAKKCIQGAIANFPYPETIDALVEGCQSKNPI